MTEVKYARNPRFVDRWARAIGRFVLDFGLLEFESHMWLLQMTDEPQVFPRIKFGRRVSLIQKLITRYAFDGQWATAASEAWKRAGQLAVLRNSLTHSPLMFGWDSPAEEGDPDWIGVVDVRLLGVEKQEAESRYTLSRIAESTTAVAALIVELSELRGKWCAAPGTKSRGLIWHPDLSRRRRQLPCSHTTVQLGRPDTPLQRDSTLYELAHE